MNERLDYRKLRNNLKEYGQYKNMSLTNYMLSLKELRVTKFDLIRILNELQIKKYHFKENSPTRNIPPKITLKIFDCWIKKYEKITILRILKSRSPAHIQWEIK